MRAWASLSPAVVNGTVYAGSFGNDPHAFNLAAGNQAPRRQGPASPHPDLSLRARR